MASAHIVMLNEDGFQEAIGKGKVLVDFYADWCGPCKRLKPQLEELSNSYKDVKFVKVNVDNQLELAEAHSISAMPTIVFYVDGEQKTEVQGADLKKITSMCEKYFV